MNIVGIGATRMQEEFGEIRGHLDHVTHELIWIKKLIIGLEVKDRQKTERAWDDLMSVFTGMERRNGHRGD